MYLSVYLFKNKPSGPYKVDFVIGNRWDKLQNLLSQNERGGIREGEIMAKNDFLTGGLLEGGAEGKERGGLNIGFPVFIIQLVVVGDISCTMIGVSPSVVGNY